MPSPPLQPIRRADSLPLRRARTLVILILRREQIDAPMSCQGFLDSCSARRLVICWARCSALARDRPVVVMTLRLPRRSRMSQVRPGGRPRELVEPVSIWTVTGGTADHFRGLARGRVRWAGGAGVAGLRTRQ